MIARLTRPAVQVLPSVDRDSGLEEHRLPVSIWLGGTVLVMNVFSAVLSLIA
jgi:hypothetical protein